MEPTFNYPTSNDDVWIKCEATDPQASECWCPAIGLNGGWSTAKEYQTHRHYPCSPTCCQIWRKKIEVPVGYRILAQNERPTFGDKVLDSGEWQDVQVVYVDSIKEFNDRAKHQYIYIRPIQSAESERDDNGSKAFARRLYGPREETPTHDPVNHPSHYTTHPSGVECIQVTEHMDFCLGNAVKYLWRAGDKGNELEDLKKARWYIDRKIQRLEGAK